MEQVKVLQIAVEVDVPAILWGPPGVGKTATIQALGESLGLEVVTVIASLHEPSDFLGLPVPSGDRTRFLPPEWFLSLGERGKGLLFLDEISTAPPAVQAAALRLVQERKIGSLALPSGVRIVLAANPPELAAGGFELSPPLANRMAHIDWAPPRVEDWARGLVLGFPAPEFKPLNWEAQLPLAKGLIAGFLSSRSHLLLRLPEDPSQLGRAWPSPRSWEMATRMLAGALAKDPEDRGLIALAVGSVVGTGVGIEVAAFVAEGLIDPREALKDPDKVSLPKRGDLVLALVAAVASVVTSAEEGVQDLWDRAWYLYDRIMTESGQKDLVLIGAQPLYAFWRERQKARKPLSLAKTQKILAKLGALLEQIGA